MMAHQTNEEIVIARQANRLIIDDFHLTNNGLLRLFLTVSLNFFLNCSLLKLKSSSSSSCKLDQLRFKLFIFKFFKAIKFNL